MSFSRQGSVRLARQLIGQGDHYLMGIHVAATIGLPDRKPAFGVVASASPGRGLALNAPAHARRSHQSDD